MKKIILFLTILFFLNIVNGLNVATVNYSFYFVGEIINENPYPVFVAVPNYINFNHKILPVPKSAVSPTISVSNGTELYVTFYDDIFNGRKGFWIYPFTSKKIVIYSQPIVKTVSVPDNITEYKIIGPIVYNSIDVIDLNNIFKYLKYNGIKIGEFKMYVSGTITKGDTDTLSIIFPIPVMFDRYSEFYKLTPDLDIWIDYNDWYYSQIKKIEKIKLEDNPLIPNDNLFESSYYIQKIPAIAYTTSSDQPLEFSYVMYK